MMTKLFKSIYKVVYVNEPDPKDVIHLTSEINRALETNKIECEYDGNSFSMYSPEGNVTGVKFSPLISHTFGLNPDKWYRDRDVVPSFSDIVLIPSSHQLLIQSDLVQTQWVFGKHVSLLFTDEVNWEKRSPIHIKSNPTYYVPLTRNKKIESIEIVFINEQMEPVTMELNSISSILLHLRPKLF
jgi:hypothetical protein